MTRIAYIDGAYQNYADGATHFEDRGYQFADGVYEYFAFFNRIILDEAPHLKRLERSLKELSIAEPMSMRVLSLAMRELIARNTRDDGGIYLQITRGVSKRDHPFPKVPVPPVLTMTVVGPKTPKPEDIEKGASVITQPEIRWARCDIKSISLLPNVLAKQAAVKAGAKEAWFVKADGVVTEGSSTNAFIVKDGEVFTHPAGPSILGGITREMLLVLAKKGGIKVHERAFTLDEAKAADEAFLTSTTSNVLPITKIDGAVIGGGKAGPVSKKLLALYQDHILQQTGKRL